ncbi:MAG: hypothetical protein WD872_02400 [Pirellulaceae bacterium]
MRLLSLAALTFTCSLSIVAVARGDEFPFEGYVAGEGADVASGPGRRFYTTDRLAAGDKVEVYREDDAGWLAIRPPEGSFSWIPAEQVELLEDGVGKVKSATESWIGTSLERVNQHKSQVLLKPGELVEVLDEKTVAFEAGEEKWLKIAPPAGEFRFVHGQDVSREPVEVKVAAVPEAEDGVEKTAEDAEPRRFRPSESSIALTDIGEIRNRLAAMRDDFSQLSEGLPDANDVQTAQFQSSAKQPARPTLSPDGFVPRKRRTSEQLQPVPAPSNPFPASPSRRSAAGAFSRPNLTPLAQVAQARPTVASPLPPRVADSQPVDSLAALELELSLMLAEDKSTWNLAALRSRVESLVESGADPVERGRARLLLDKVNQFEETFEVSGQAALASGDNAGTAPASGSAADPRYDAQGWLKPVISRSKPAAPYAVVDRDGNPLCFVTPSPGMNVGRYVNKQVGLYGRRGYIEALNTPHVVAERVIDLERHLR